MGGEDVTITVSQPSYLVQGIQLKERYLVPKWLGNLILWLFFHRQDTATQITLTDWTRGGGK